jgi:pSer/pThr/pTyr-binding forkhead associated (FHA) protein/Mg-chelatase subunit ChlD
VFLLLLVGWIVLVNEAHAQEKAQAPPPPKLDILIVLDNSGSMKKSDPGFLTRQAVIDFLDSLTGDARLGILIFADKAELALPLTKIGEEDVRDKVLASLDRVDYSGRYTNIPVAIERALYDLKQRGRKDSQKLIIFMTDGFISTGDKDQDRDGGRWLREELAADCKDSGVKIFGVAFTEEADYRLIQSLSQRTDGEYYRALRAGDLRRTFTTIQEVILKPIVATRPAAVPGASATGSAPQPTTGLSKLVIAGIVVLIILALGIVAVRRRSADAFRIREEAVSGQSSAVSEKQLPTANDQQPITNIPDAFLIDLGQITDRGTYKIDKRVIRIGRAQGETSQHLEVAIPKETVSALHATVEFRDGSFYLIDQRSTNGTHLNGKRITGEVLLKSGDVIAFERHKFKFLLPGPAEHGGTLLAQLAAGGTVVSVPDPSSSPSSLPSEGGPAAPGSSFLQEEEEAQISETGFKEPVCPIHTSYVATEVCVACHQNYCQVCMTEADGQQVCKRCAARK